MLHTRTFLIAQTLASLLFQKPDPTTVWEQDPLLTRYIFLNKTTTVILKLLEISLLEHTITTTLPVEELIVEILQKEVTKNTKRRLPLAHVIPAATDPSKFQKLTIHCKAQS